MWTTVCRSLRFAVAATVAVAMAAVITTSCDDDDLDAYERPEPDDDYTIDDPFGLKGTGVALAFDTEATDADMVKNITIKAIADVENAYALTIDATAMPQYVTTIPLLSDLPDKQVKLSFSYKCEENVGLDLQYLTPEAGEAVQKSTLLASTSVDVDENGWAAAEYVIDRDINENDWGSAGQSLRLIFKPTSTEGNVVFSIKDIYLYKTSESQTATEFDPYRYDLTFTPNRGSHWSMEDVYGIYSGISFDRISDEYILRINDSYAASGSAAEHFIATDPLTRAIELIDGQQLELVFKYKADADFNLRTGLYPFSDPANDWPASFVTTKLKASASTDRDEEGWATCHHNITKPVKAMKWGSSVDNGDQQIRFCLLSPYDELHPELYGLTSLRLKDIHLQVVTDSPDHPNQDEPKSEAFSLMYSDGDNRGYETGVSAADGVYQLDFKASAPEHVVWSLGVENGIAHSNWELRLFYQCTIDVTEVNCMLFDGGFSYYQPFGNPFISGSNTQASANQWKEVVIDLSKAIDAVRWNLDGKTGERLRINFNMAAANATLRIKDARLVPKTDTPVEPDSRKPFTPTSIDDLNTVYNTKLTNSDNSTMTLEYTASAPEHVVWFNGPDEPLPDADYSIQFTYQCDHPMNEVNMMLFDKGMTYYMFDGDPFVHFDDWKGATGEWKTIVCNLKTPISKVNWNIGKNKERLRINFNPVPATGEAVTLKIKDIKIFPNSASKARRPRRR